MTRWAAILAGGSGTRFWPLSTPAVPKQFLALAGEKPLLAQAVERLSGLISSENTLVVTGRDLRDRTLELLPHIPEANVLVEPRAASTGPALTWATWLTAQRDPEATVLSLHADWYVGDDDAFRKTAAAALGAAEQHDRLVTVGVVPTRPDVGYGYIVPGQALAGGLREVERFEEKPDEATARLLIQEGALWNSGLFAWTATRFLSETEAIAPEIGPHIRHLTADRPADFFRDVTPIAVDVSHLERSPRVGVVPGDFPWDDVGTWPALSRVREPDDSGNVLVGRSLQRDAERCISWADDGTIVLDGVRDLVVVRANGVTLVTTPDRAAHLKDLVNSLPEHTRALAEDQSA